MAQPTFQGRSAYSGRFPERTAPSSSQQPHFGQSAPGFGRQVVYSQQPPPPQQQQPYGPYPQYAAGQGAGPGRGQAQAQMVGIGVGMGVGIEKESSALNDLSQDQKDEIREAFSIFDLDKDGNLDLHELRVGLRALGFDVQREELLQLIYTHGIPKPGAQPISEGRGQRQHHASQMLIPEREFTKIAAQKMNDRDPREEVDRAFKLFDADQKGYISIDDLRRVAQELGETNLEEQELQTMIEEFDYEGMGGVSREAFFGICLQ